MKESPRCSVGSTVASCLLRVALCEFSCSSPVSRHCLGCACFPLLKLTVRLIATYKMPVFVCVCCVYMYVPCDRPASGIFPCVVPYSAWDWIEIKIWALGNRVFALQGGTGKSTLFWIHFTSKGTMRIRLRWYLKERMLWIRKISPFWLILMTQPN